MVLEVVNSRHQIDYHNICLPVKTTSQLSAVTSETLVCNNNVSTPMGVDNNNKVEVMRKSNGQVKIS